MNSVDSVESSICSRLEKLSPQFLEVVNESSNHNVPKNSETHFKVTIVSTDFAKKNLLSRHRMVNETLASLLAGPVHALALHTYSPKEWIEKAGDSKQSPPCLGGSKV